MNFSELLSRVVQDTVGSAPWGDLGRALSGQHGNGSLLLFLPELVVVATILALLFARLLDLDKRISGQSIALFGSTIGLLLAVVQFLSLKNPSTLGTEAAVNVTSTMFTGLLIFDPFTVYFRVFLLLFLQLVVYLTRLTGVPDQEDAPDFYTLLFGSTLGMLLMVSANHLLTLFLAIEMTSVPSYAMVGFLKGRRTSSEASFKYVVYGAGAAGVMLYGISLLAGLLGTAHFPEMATRLNLLVTGTTLQFDATLLTLLLAIVMIMVGFAFKLSIFPFHFWCPDAFEGAATEVAGFLSIASKGAAFAALVRICLAFVGVNQEGLQVSPALSTILLQLGVGMGVIGAVTATFGNLAAYSQNNIKRLLAYSTIAHAGYMLMAVGAMMVMLNAVKQVPDPLSRWQLAMRAIEGLLYYLWVYLFMNLGAFSVAAFLRNQLFSENLTDYGGIWTQAPVLAFTMACCMFSLIGMPPFGGFVGKFMIFSSLLQAGTIHWAMWGVLVVAGLNTVFSLFYYIRVLRFMFIAPAADDARRVKAPLTSSAGMFAMVLAVFVLLTGVMGEPLSNASRYVATYLFP